jgi:hypothetical protein
MNETHTAQLNTASKKVILDTTPTDPGITTDDKVPLIIDKPSSCVVTYKEVITQRLYRREYTVDSFLWLGQSIDLFRIHWKYYSVWGLVYLLVIVLTILFPPFIILVVPMSGGLWYATFNLIRTTGSSTIKKQDFFQGFKWILPVFGITFLQIVLILMGLLLFIAPGIYLAVCLQFSLIFLMEYYEEDISVFDSMKICFAVCKNHFCSLLGFLCLCELFFVSGILFFGVGLILTVPMAHIAQCYAMRDIFGLRDHHRYSIDHNLP